MNTGFFIFGMITENNDLYLTVHSSDVSNMQNIHKKYFGIYPKYKTQLFSVMLSLLLFSKMMTKYVNEVVTHISNNNEVFSIIGVIINQCILRIRSRMFVSFDYYSFKLKNK